MLEDKIQELEGAIETITKSLEDPEVLEYLKQENPEYLGSLANAGLHAQELFGNPEVPTRKTQRAPSDWLLYVSTAVGGGLMGLYIAGTTAGAISGMGVGLLVTYLSERSSQQTQESHEGD